MIIWKLKLRFGNIKLTHDMFSHLNTNTLFFTGLKTDKVLELIPKSQIISFLDFEEVENVNNELTVQGTLADIRDRKNDTVCVLDMENLEKNFIGDYMMLVLELLLFLDPKNLFIKIKL